MQAEQAVLWVAPHIRAGVPRHRPQASRAGLAQAAAGQHGRPPSVATRLLVDMIAASPEPPPVRVARLGSRVTQAKPPAVSHSKVEANCALERKARQHSMLGMRAH